VRPFAESARHGKTSPRLQERNSDCGLEILSSGKREPASRPAELRFLTSRGGIYLGIRYGLGILVSFGNMLVMTRWIGPHAYGLFVTAVGLTSFLASLTRGGIDTYLVRAEAIPHRRAYDVAATLIGMLSALLVVVGAAITPALCAWYRSREFVPVYLVTLLTIPLAGLAGAAMAKLERDLNFRAVAGIELGGQILALCISILLAWRGVGVWAPACGLLAWQAWVAVGAMKTAKLCPRFAFDRAQARAMLAFGIGYSASLRVWQLRTLVNPLIVGRFAGAEGVAYVGVAIRIAEGLGFVRAAAGRLAIATLSRLRQDGSQFRIALQRALEIQVLALGPLLCLFALVAPVAVPRVLGARWLPAMRLYPFIAAGVLVNSLYNLQASALFVAGRQWTVLRAYALQVCLLAICSAAFLPYLGLAGYGWAELAACGAYRILHTGLGTVIRLSYAKLAPLAFALLLPPFALLAPARWTVLFWLPLVVSAGFAFQSGVDRKLRENPGIQRTFLQLRSRWSRTV
jgi:O-antigen/teichoic acid export membrane protein